jgi:TolB-like protein
MKKYVVVLYFLLIGVVFAFAQKATTLAQAISLAQEQIETELLRQVAESDSEARPKVVVYDLGIRLLEKGRNTKDLADYVLEQLVAALTRGGKLDVPSRGDIWAARQKEVSFQGSLEVDEEEMLDVGHAMGADYVVAGNVREFGDNYELNIMIADMKRGRNISPVKILLNKNDKQTKDLLGITADEQNDAKKKRDADRQVFLNEQAKRESRFVIGGAAGVSVMFSNHEGKDALYTPKNSAGTAYKYENEGATAFTGQFSLGLNSVGKKTLGFRLNGVFSLNEGLTTTQTDPDGTGESIEFLEFSYSTFDLGLLIEIAPVAQTIVFTFYVGPYISIPVGDLKLEIGGSEVPNAELEPFAGPIGNIGAIAGLSFGYKVGFAGYIVLDVRYKYDFLPTKFSAVGVDSSYKDPTDFYHRHGLQLTLGYEFWI